MTRDLPLLGRLTAKLVADVMPAAMASVIAGLAFSHFQPGAATGSAAASVAPASVEMMEMVRDEHVLILDYLKAQLAAEKARLAAQPGRSAVAAESSPVAAAAVRQRTAMAVPAKRADRHESPTIASSAPPVPAAPIEIVRTAAAGPAQPPARDPDSFVGRTINVKDHVVAVTKRAVTGIAGIPSWIASFGDRIGGPVLSPPRPLPLEGASAAS